MEYAEEVILDQGRQPQIPPPYATDLIPSATQHTQTQGAAAFSIGEGNGPLPIMYYDMHQNPTTPQEQQLPNIDTWRNKAPFLTGIPVFGGDSHARSPFTIPDDFIQFLFSGNNLDRSTNNENLAVNHFPR